MAPVEESLEGIHGELVLLDAALEPAVAGDALGATAPDARSVATRIHDR